ncbi:pyridoxal phosphate-dependent transferase [Kockovaella imperatae]|uniref:Pyridoxal phosphate-dependent transferase n=1 Tax=Kockovaella imperatae TaxID=4999 RepID=A0A1Y1UB25_9TREE|nr:pyridoxal phosphate-dependent transferase [Kockovaella imperatae]ORX34285.1 pyridoxal phosphate-dependent transferase [Kockovaella imperatae]
MSCCRGSLVYHSIIHSTVQSSRRSLSSSVCKFPPFPTSSSSPTLRRSLAFVSSMPVPMSKPEVTAEVGGQRNVDKLLAISRDFRSDTMTIPTDAQLLASLRASRGDDLYSEDEDTAALEARVARLTGKEAALFGVSGTMTNQLAIRTHMKQPPHSVITDYRAHVHKMEAGGIAMFSQATTHQLVPHNGIYLTVEDIEPALVLGEDIHTAPTKLICIENTLSGTIIPQEEVVRIGELARRHDIIMHLDGARIWNVAAKVVEDRVMDPRQEEDLRVALTELCEPFESVSLCLSKGIGAPIGSMLVGSKDFIKRARWFRKAFGGGVRQSGGMAAAADYAITHHFPRLADSHALARRLEQGLSDLGCEILAPVDTSMVFFSPLSIGLTLDSVSARLKSLPVPITMMRERLVLHHQTSPQAVEDFIACVAEMKAEVEDGKGAEVRKEGEQSTSDEKMVVEGKLRKQAVLGY